MKKVYKYGTGEEIPEGAIYLSTIVGTTIMQDRVSRHTDRVKKGLVKEKWKENKTMLVWHYFLVDVE